MINSVEARQKLERFKSDRRSEVEYGPIEKFMIEDLGVTKIKTGKAPGKRKGKGSILFYKHPLLKEWNMSDEFTVHRKHKKRLMIYKRNFDKRLYPVLLKIIIAMPEEA